MDRNYVVIIFISKYLFLRRPGVAILAGIIKIVTIFNKIQTISAFDIAKFADFW